MYRLRGAVSIARRLQDPLAELVKIDPKSIGVGQYQHDVSQTQLARSLDAVVEDCVNAVGVDVNTASAPLLARVSGLNATSRKHRQLPRPERRVHARASDLRKVPRLGDKTFEQAAGFLRMHERRQSAGRLGGAPGGLSGGRADPRRPASRIVRGVIGDARAAEGLKPGQICRREVRRADRHATS